MRRRNWRTRVDNVVGPRRSGAGHARWSPRRHSASTTPRNLLSSNKCISITFSRLISMVILHIILLSQYLAQRNLFYRKRELCPKSSIFGRITPSLPNKPKSHSSKWRQMTLFPYHNFQPKSIPSVNPCVLSCYPAKRSITSSFWSSRPPLMVGGIQGSRTATRRS